jgi:hypothetical protein
VLGVPAVAQQRGGAAEGEAGEGASAADFARFSSAGLAIFRSPCSAFAQRPLPTGSPGAPAPLRDPIHGYWAPIPPLGAVTRRAESELRVGRSEKKLSGSPDLR